MNKKGFINNSSKLERFNLLQNNLSSLIKTLKQEYFSKIAKKLSDLSISSETWSVLKSFFRNVVCFKKFFNKSKGFLYFEMNVTEIKQLVFLFQKQYILFYKTCFEVCILHRQLYT